MATSQTIIDRATLLLRVRPAGTTYSSVDSNINTDLFAIFQEFISEWSEDGIANIPAPSTVGATLDIPEGSVRGLANNFAVEIAPIFGKDPDIVIAGIARETKDRFEADVTHNLEVDMSDMAFTRMGRYNIEQDR